MNCMKKIVNWLLMLSVVFLSFGSVYAAEGELFAKNTILSEGYLSLDSTSTRAQTFTAGVDTITSFSAYLRDRVAGSTIVAYLINESSKEVMAEDSERMDGGDGWEEFVFNTALDKESVYRVKILVPNVANVKWVYSNDNYPGGMRYYGENTYAEDSDLVFQAWGTNDPVAPDEQQAPPVPESSDQPSSDTNVSSAEAPATTTSSAIAKPTELVATLNTGAVDLAWKKSATADIDGYKVFRSETAGKNFTKIGEVGKNVLTFSDTNTQSEKTYYYIVRAYKGMQESASSNEVSITLPSDDGLVLISDLNEGAEEEKGMSLLWKILIPLIIIILAVVGYLAYKKYKAKKSKQKINPVPPATPKP